MFTGIIEQIGTVRKAHRRPGRLVLEIVHSGGWSPRAGESISVSGACLSVVEPVDAGFRVEALPETLDKTNLHRLAAGSRVNLERALRVGDVLGGHWVQGHVDGTGTVASMARQGDSWLFDLKAVRDILRYIVAKGSIAVDGVSLTVVRKQRSTFRVMIVPFTMEHTVFGNYRRGDEVNLECDILAKYVAECLKYRGRRK